MRVCYSYDQQTDRMVFSGGVSITQATCHLVGLADIAVPLFTFAKAVASMRLTWMEMALLAAICFFCSGIYLNSCFSRH